MNKRTREDILEDIEYYTKWAEDYTKWAEDFTKDAEKNTKWAEEAEEELRAFDKKEKGDE